MDADHVLLRFAETPLLMIPGHDQTLSIWTPDLLKTLASGREVIIFDYANFGLSTGVGTAAAASLQGGRALFVTSARIQIATESTCHHSIAILESTHRCAFVAQSKSWA